ncbi:MAG: hypothetical protein IIY09_00070 [Clostridia bacterium]|nr:hypothetical protein [Clostridia bacterium]
MVLDVILLAAFLIVAIVGGVKGFSNILCGLFTAIGCTVGVSFFTPQLAEWLGDGLGQSISESFIHSFAQKELYATAIISGNPAETATALSSAGISPFLVKLLASFVNKMLAGETGTVAEILGKLCGKLCCYLIAGLLILITVTVFFMMLGMLLKKARDFKAFRYIDGFIGVFILVSLVLAVVWVAFAFVSANATSVIGTKVIAFIEDSTLAKALYHANPLSEIFS